jgi:hypothetical protein
MAAQAVKIMDEERTDIIESAPSRVCQYTDGQWPDEAEAVRELDARLARCAHIFLVHREVPGTYVQPRYRTVERQPRIDRLLIPKSPLIDAGWNHGVIGVECKCSGKKLGTIIAQCQDYGRAVFRTPNNFALVCEWIFIWPLGTFAGDVASVMTQNRIGGLCGDRYTLLKFKAACGNLMTISWDGVLDVRPMTAGQKVGSR